MLFTNISDIVVFNSLFVCTMFTVKNRILLSTFFALSFIIVLDLFQWVCSYFFIIENDGIADIVTLIDTYSTLECRDMNDIRWFVVPEK